MASRRQRYVFGAVVLYSILQIVIHLEFARHDVATRPQGHYFLEKPSPRASAKATINKHHHNVSNRPKHPPIPRQESNETTMSACLFIMDDTIRLMEWIAYHYTVLPLGHLVVAIDPKSKRQDRILSILDSWRPYFRIDAYANDTWFTLGPEEGWGRHIYGPKGGYRHWFTDHESDFFKAQSHKRRQNFFMAFCMRSLFEAGSRSWTLLVDSDEYLLFNYRHAASERPDVYDSATLYTSHQDIDRARRANLPLRNALPPLQDRVTVAQYLQNYTNTLTLQHGPDSNQTPRCLRFPHLQFSSHEINSGSSDPHSLPDPASLLMTQRQTQTGPMEGTFSKAMVDLSRAKKAEWFVLKNVVNVHTPSRRMCGRTRKKSFTASGTDYIASLFRINHYRSGTLETYLERSGDYRGGSIWRLYAERNIAPVLNNSDIVPWIDWFVDKVGQNQANQLLLYPLWSAYEEFGTGTRLEEARAVWNRLQRGGGEDGSTPSYPYNRTNTSMAVCLLMGNDSIRLAEWMAYHYTVLPMRHLIVGLLPNTTRQAEIQRVLNLWKGRIQVELWRDDVWLEGIGALEGYQRRPTVPGTHQLQEWFEAEGAVYRAQVDIRRANAFAGTCLHHLKTEWGATWTTVVDIDEFVGFNYKGAAEDPKRYDIVDLKQFSKPDIIEMREHNEPIRSRLPDLERRVTVADFLTSLVAEETGNVTKCLFLPTLNYTSPLEDGGTSKRAQNLVTVRNSEFGRKEGLWSRAVLNLESAPSKQLSWRYLETVRNPNHFICGRNGKLGRGADYISSLLRVNRYPRGTMESIAESGGFQTRSSVVSEFERAGDFEVYGHDTKIQPWVGWFEDSAGSDAAASLLWEPLHDLAAAFRNQFANDVQKENDG